MASHEFIPRGRPVPLTTLLVVLVLATAFSILPFFPPAMAAAPASPALPPVPGELSISGTVEWSAGYPLGEAEALRGTGLAPGVLRLEQRIHLGLTGVVLPAVTVRADLDNSRGDNLQLLALTLDSPQLHGRLGNQTTDSEIPQTIASFSINGVSLAYDRSHSPWEYRLVVGRVTGIPESRTFTGGSSEETVQYVAGGPEVPTRQEGILVAGLAGMPSARLAKAGFDEQFTQAFLVYRPSGEGGGGLREFLAGYGLDYLYAAGGGGDDEPGVIREGEGRAIPGGQYAVVPGDGYEHIVFRRPVLQLVRQHVQELIQEYNEKNGLRGEAARRYPFVAGTGEEETFLTRLTRGFLDLVVGTGAGDPDPLLAIGLHQVVTSRRFYDLGHAGIVPDSVEVQVFQRNVWRKAQEIPGFSFTVAPESGVVEFSLPAGFSWETDSVRVHYRYRVADNVYWLGTGIVRASEKVYLNDRLLTRDQDYSIDYENGLLIMLRPVLPSDRLRIDYEHYRGWGGGGFAEYQANVVGLRSTYAPDDKTSLTIEGWQAWESAPPEAERINAITMPGTHRVAAVSLKTEKAGFELEASAAFSWNQFPFDDNRRPPQANQVETIAFEPLSPSGDGVLLVGHRAGLTVLWRGKEEQYGPMQGVAGAVFSLAVSPEAFWAGTERGLLRVARDSGGSGPGTGDPGESSPFARLANWSRYRRAEGLPSDRVTALAIGGGWVWAGTEAGLAGASLTDLANWRTLLGSEAIESLAWEGTSRRGALWIGTTRRLVRLEWDGEGGNVREIRLVTGETQAITAVCVVEASPDLAGVWVATRDRLFHLPAGSDPYQPGNWSVVATAPELDGELLSLAFWPNGGGPGLDRLAVGTNTGLWVVAANGTGRGWNKWRIEGTFGWEITAVTAAPPTADPVLWAGSRGSLRAEPKPGDSSRHFVRLWSASSEDSWQVVEGDEIGIPGDDPYRRDDLPASGHERSGFAARLSLGRSWSWGEVDLRLLHIDPGFLTIGQRRRSDLTSGELELTLTPAPGLGVTASYSQRVAGPEGEGEGERYRAAVYGLSFEAARYGAELDGAYRRENVDDRNDGRLDRARTSVRLAASYGFWQDRLRLNASWEGLEYRDVNRPGSDTSSGEITVGVRATPSRSWSWEVEFRRPWEWWAGSSGVPPGRPEAGVAVEEWTSRASWNLTLGGSPRRPLWRWTGLATALAGRRLPGGEEQQSLYLQSNASFATFMLGTWEVIPAFSVRHSYLDPYSGEPHSISRGEGSTRLTGSLAPGITAELSAGSSVELDAYPLSRRLTQRWSTWLAVTAETGRRWRPELNLSWRESRSVHPRYGQRRTTEMTVEAGVRSPLGIAGLAAEQETKLRLGRQRETREGSPSVKTTHQARLTGMVSYSPAGGWGVALTGAVEAEWEALAKPKTVVEIGGSVARQLGSTWDVGVSLTYRRVDGEREGDPAARAWIPKVTVKAVF